MTAVILGLVASVAFGATTVLVHRGLRGLDALSGLMVDLWVNTVLLWLSLLLFYDFTALWASHNLIFVVAGLLVPGLFRLLTFQGIERLGPSVSAAVVNTTPFFAILVAVLLLDERPSRANLLGALFIVVGLTFSSWRGTSRTWRTRDLVFPLGAALLAASRDNLVRFGLVSGPPPLVGATIAATTSALTMAIVYLPKWGFRRFSKGRAGSLACFYLSGSLHFMAYITMFGALALAEVSVVTPLVHCFSLFTLVFAYVFLGHSDPITTRKAAATLSIVLGALLISFERL